MVSMSDTWDRTAAFLSQHLGTVCVLAALVLFLPDAADGVLQQWFVDAGAGARLGVAIATLVFSLISLFGQLALVMLVLDPARGVGGALRDAGPRLPTLIGISLLVLAALMLAGLPLIALVARDGMDMTAMERGALPTLSGATAAVMAAYLLIGLPLLVWISSRLAVASAVIAAERRGLGALGRSFRLTRGHAARIFGTLLLIMIVGGVAILATNLVVGSVLRLLIGRPDGFDPAAAATGVIVALATTALTVVLIAFTTMLYQALVARDGAAAA